MSPTILDNDQIFGKNQLEIFKKRGTKAAISDFAILLGGHVSNNYYANDVERLENRTCWYWTKTDDGNNDARVVDWTGSDNRNNVNNCDCGVRPALPYSSISSISSNKVRAEDGILEVECGEYPQQAASKDIQKSLENLFQIGFLRATRKTYTTDSVKYNRYDYIFQRQEQEHIEYVYNGKKYVRVKANIWDGQASTWDRQVVTLSNEEKYEDDDYVWIEVQPIRWLVDEEKDIAVAEKLLFAGVEFNHVRNYKGDFEQTDMYNFLNICFVKDIIPSKIKLQPETRNFIITESNIEYKTGINITISMPTEIVNQVDSIILQSSDNKQIQKVYKKSKN